MMNINKVILAGRVTKVESNTTKSDKAVTTLTMVTSESYEGKDGQREERAEWHRIVTWGKLAEYCGKYLEKGDVVFVEGKISTRKWTDKENKERTTTEIVASTVQAAPRGVKKDQQDTKDTKDNSSHQSNKENGSNFSLEE